MGLTLRVLCREVILEQDCRGEGQLQGEAEKASAWT